MLRPERALLAGSDLARLASDSAQSPLRLGKGQSKGCGGMSWFCIAAAIAASAEVAELLRESCDIEVPTELKGQELGLEESSADCGDPGASRAVLGTCLDSGARKAKLVGGGRGVSSCTSEGESAEPRHAGKSIRVFCNWDSPGSLPGANVSKDSSGHSADTQCRARQGPGPRIAPSSCREASKDLRKSSGGSAFFRLPGSTSRCAIAAAHGLGSRSSLSES